MSPSSKGPTDNRRAAARQPSPECSDHDPNTGPGSDYCVNCGKYEPDLSPRTAAGRALLGTAYLAGDAQSEGVDLRHAILAIEAEAAAPAGLDVERLKQALINEGYCLWENDRNYVIEDGDLAGVAAEYARLAEEPREVEEADYP